MARVVLVGMPGTGKSTLARLLATASEATWVDTDDLIELVRDATPAEILDSEGEEIFRAYEIAALRSALVSFDVVATGGGIVTTRVGREILQGERVVWLTCPLDVLATRVENSDRPLVRDAPAERLASLWAEREELYASVATWELTTDGDVTNCLRQLMTMTGVGQ